MPYKIQVALNTSVDLFVFSIPVSYSVILQPIPQRVSSEDFNSLMARPN